MISCAPGRFAWPIHTGPSKRPTATALSRAREDFAGRAGEAVGGLEVVDAPVAVEQGQQRAGRAVGGAGDGERLLDGAMRGIDAALRFAAGRPQAAAADIGRRRRLRFASREPRQRFEHARQRRVGDLAAVEARLGRLAHREFAPRPHRAGVHLAARLDQRHAPVRLALEDRPVERRRPLVAAHAGMDDERAHGAPDVLGDRTLEERREDDVGPEQRDRLVRHRVVDVELDRDLVPRLAQRDMQPLGQRVEAVAEEQDAHQGRLMRASPFSRSREKVASEARRAKEAG